MPHARPALLPFLIALSGCVTGSPMIPKTWLSVPRATPIRAVAFAGDGKVTPAQEAPAPKPATFPRADTLAAVESFDVSDARGEVAFAAKKTPADSFDIGLVAIEGSEISWVPSDPADEVAVQWAPRGNKISYVVRAQAGDVVRTVHIPTAFQETIEFPSARVHALGWEPQAERFAVAYSSPDASDRVEVMKFDGEARRLVVKPSASVDVEVEPFGPDAISIRRRDVEYGERLPLVVWTDDDLYAWNDARGALLRNARVAMVVTRKAPDGELFRKAKELTWVDASRTFIVEGKDPEGPLEPAAALRIAGDSTVPAGRYRRSGNVVAVAPAVVQSFAAAFIADELRRTGPTHGFTR